MGEDKISVREFEPERDAAAVEEMEKQCDVSPAGSCGEDDDSEKMQTRKKKKKKKKKKIKAPTTLFVDLLGDPLCRVRYFSNRVMLIAEYGEQKQIVGVVRASIKTVTRGSKGPDGSPAYARVAYILGLRVSPHHRRMGVATRLVEAAEEWCRKEGGAEYAYMATERSNAASLNLFTVKFSYTPFRFPSVLVQPVHAHPLKLSKGAAVLPLPPAVAEPLYRRLFAASSEFFPKDISAVLANPLTLGTFMAIPSWEAAPPPWDPWRTDDAGGLPPSFAVMSLWNSKEMFRMQVKGGSAAARLVLRWWRAADERLPWAGIPSLPDLFRPFGVYFMYGLHAEGKGGGGLMRTLCRLAHNLAREDRGCAAVVAELGRDDPVREGVPHWRSLSWDEDVWCMKKLVATSPSSAEEEEEDYDNWVSSKPSTDVVFVDPRDF